MAGIGFELRKLLRRDSFGGLLRAYGYAGLISAGPWLFSITGVIIIGICAGGFLAPPLPVVRFLVTVTWLLSLSLIFTGLLQLMFTRFVADRLYEKKSRAILENLFGALTVTALSAGLLATLAAIFLFHESLAYRLLFVATFVTLSASWIVVVMLSGLKEYRAVIALFFAGYGISTLFAIALKRYGTEGLLAGFLFGQAVLFFSLLTLVIRGYPGDRLVAFDFLRKKNAFYDLGAVGFVYSLAIWADKLLFWMNPLTSEPVIGPLRHSVIYDLPIFLAYLSIVPGMAVFLVRVETDFAECYDAFYEAVRGGGTLSQIEALKDGMVRAVRDGIVEIFKVQGLTVLLLFLAGPRLLRLAGISELYLPLFYVDLVGVGVQVILLAILNVFFYLDRRRIALFLSSLFLGANVLFTLATQKLGAAFYGYGFTVAVTVTTLCGLVLLARALDRLEYRTFMLQR